jgi:environmental stress-induced protein Ves
MQVLRRADHVQMRWKNGAGTSLEIASGGVPGEPFDWRLSLARIEQPGRFSNYDGYDRVTALVEGAGFTLQCAGATELEFMQVGQCHAYPGAVQYGCVLHAGACTDLNLIARRGLGASMTVVPVDAAGRGLESVSATRYVLPLAGRATVNTPQESARLEAWDAAVLAVGQRAWLAADEAAGSTLVALVAIPPWPTGERP